VGIVTASEPITITVQNDTFDVEIVVVPIAAGGRVSGFDCDQVSVRRRPGGPPVTGLSFGEFRWRP
jgi:hypothetical protein